MATVYLAVRADGQYRKRVAIKVVRHHADADEILRRDHFWTAIVFFRERRWNESFAEFNRARGDNGEVDQPLQMYLRRLEPVCLNMMAEPTPISRLASL